jgi:hypothetical protein
LAAGQELKQTLRRLTVLHPLKIVQLSASDRVAGQREYE